MRLVKRMRTGLGLTTVALIMVLALTSTGAQATRGARMASTCSNETVNGGKYVEDVNLRGELTLRFVLIGSVTCDEAHRVVRAYFGKMAADQQCGKLNSFCDLQFAGGWDCFMGPPAKQQDGAIAGCARTGAKIRLYKVSPPAPPSLNGPIVIAATCAGPLSAPGSLCAGQIGSKARDYIPSFGATVGSYNPDADGSEVILLKKMMGHYSQTHEWGVKFLPSEVRIINRSKNVLIEVKHPIGHHGADGKLDFTFSGGPVHTRSTRPPCGEKSHVAYGTITGTIQIKVHDRFFKTITITRMRSQAADSPVYTCNPPPTTCGSPGYFLQGSSPPQFSTHTTEVSITAATLSVSVPLSVIVNEPTAGTPFTNINALMELGQLGGTKTFLKLGPNLTSATLSTPGGVISGGLSVQSYGISTTFPEPCKVAQDQITNQPVHVTKGKVTTTFDSTGEVSIGTNSTFSLESIKRVP